jgi:hypothetical protein
VHSFKVFSAASSSCEAFISAGLGGVSAGLGGAIHMFDVRVHSVHTQEV